MKSLPASRRRSVKTKRLAAPFPFERECIWEAEDGAPDRARMQEVLDGNLELIDVGCGQTFNLIVTGPCRGEVWGVPMWASTPAVSGRTFRAGLRTCIHSR